MFIPVKLITLFMHSDLDTFENQCSDYSPDELKCLLEQNNNLLIVHHNVRSFNKNFDNLSLLLNRLERDVDIVVLSETWFTEDFHSEIEGYNGYHVFRSDKVGGGVSVYVRAELRSSFLAEHSLVTDNYEICAVEIIPDSDNQINNFILLGIYRPPQRNSQILSDHFENLFIQLRNKTIFLCGDLNIDLINDDIDSDFLNNLYSHNFFPLINIPTRVTDQSSTCIDHMWFNKLVCQYSGTIITDITDHYPIFCVIYISKKKDLIYKTFRLHSNNNIDRLCDDVVVMRDDYFATCSLMNVEDKCSWYVKHLDKLYGRDCPKKTKAISVKSLLKPWITNEIKRMANHKHCLFRQYKRQLIEFNIYNNYKNNLNRLIKMGKRRYYTDKFNNCHNNSKKTWKVISSILSRPSKKTNNITLLDNRGHLTENQTDVCNIFCDHFSSVANKLDSEIPITNKDPLDYIPDPITASFNPSPATSDEIINIIMSLKDKPSHVNSIPIFIYKKLAHIIAPIICDIFNSSVAEGQFPSCLKVARITPLYKSKNKQLKSNYRPISLLPFMSKLLEKLLKRRTCEFVDRNDILYDRQFGFRSGCNTTDAALLFVDDCVDALDNRMYVITVFLDFSKAFDTVNNSILLRKLDRLGFRGKVNELLESYLCDRRIYVSMNGCNSDVRYVNIGVPQGSVSAAWLFSLYINDMHRSSKKLKFIHFADDTVIYMCGSNLSQLSREFCEELKLVDMWLNTNRLSLNIEKTHFMVHSHKTFDINDCIVKIRDTPINHVRSVKFLGIIIDERFNFNLQVSSLVKQLSKVRGLSYKLSSYIPPVILRKIYYSLFYSRLSYGIQVWGGSNKTSIDKLSRLNRSAINIFIYNLPPDISPPLNYNSIYIFNCLLTLYKYSRNDHFIFFNSKIRNLIPQHSHVTRFVQCNNYSIPSHNKSISQKQFFYNAVNFWNLLTPTIKEIDSQPIFKTNLKQYVRENY